MIYLCKCGARKSGQPYKSAVTKAWICEKCASRGSPRPKIKTVTRVLTLEMFKRKVVR
jgi:hypothetical protein